jgi:hypothetical protein
MADWATVKLTSRCTGAPTDGLILLPIGSTVPKGRRLLLDGDGRNKLIKTSIRSDNGQAACVSGATLATFGGEGAQVRYRGVSFAGTLWRDRWLAAQFAISVLTLAAALLTGYLTYLKNSAEKAGSVPHETAFIALVLASALSLLKFLKEYREL